MRPNDLHPFAGRLVRPEWAERVVSPPYDALTPAERREYAASNVDTFLHVTRSPEDAGDAHPAEPAELARASRVAVERLVAIGAYRPAATGVYLYRLRTDVHEQTGIVVDVSLEAFAAGRIRGHEATRPARSEVLAHHLDGCGSMSSPVALMYRTDNVLANAIERWRAAEPVLDFVSHGVLAQTVWRVEADDALDVIADRLEGRSLYITDGHHRAAGASLSREWSRSRGEAPRFERILAVLFSEHELAAVGFHRRIRGPVDLVALLDALRDRFTVVELGADAPIEPPRGAFLAALGRRWFEVIPLSWPTERGAVGLDVAVLHALVIEGVMGLSTNDRQVEFVSGRTPLADLAEVTGADGGVAFVAASPTLGQVTEVADRGEFMPPKSTYFDPKPRSGVFLRLEPDV